MYRLLFALLLGFGFSSAIPLLLGVPSIFIAVPAMFLVLPGMAAAEFAFRSNSPFVIMSCNAFVYSVLAYILLALKRGADGRFLRLASIYSVVPVAALVVSSSMPSLNPLFPSGMADLGRQENALQNAFPDNMNIESARAMLHSKNIEFNEFQPSTGIVFQRGEATMEASYGDRLIHSRFPTNAAQFPCGYDMEIDLLFDPAGKLKQRYIHRFRICP